MVREVLEGGVADGGTAPEREHVVSDRVQEMRLAKAGRCVQEQRVVGLAGVLRDRQCRPVSEPVALADHELGEAVAWVESPEDVELACRWHCAKSTRLGSV